MMKQADKKDVDLLLRNLAKSGRSTVDNSVDPTSQHLDADELSSYAEDVLPTTARARYTAHIADCDNCRRIVTSLALAAGTAARSKDEVVQTHGSIWNKLRELFSPGVLRYAVPALAVFAIIAVAVVSMRRDDNYVARNDQPTSTSATKADDRPQNEPADSSSVRTPAGETGSLARTAPESTNVNSKPKSQTTASGKGDEGLNKEVPTRETQANEPTYAPEPGAAAPPPAPQPADRPAKTESASNSREQQERAKDNEASTSDEIRAGARAQRNEVETAATKTKNSPSGVGGIVAQRRVANLEDKKAAAGESDKAAKMRSDRETRSVAGRSFYREANAWIDTAYNSTQAVTVVRRGSEQYRALMADEPGLKSIAETLGGTVVVVWKGRVYRIQ